MTTDVKTSVAQKRAAAPVVTLEKSKGESLWADAFKRLMRNRLAVIGLVVIILLILAAIFAPQIAYAVYPDKAKLRPGDEVYAKQVLTANNAVPGWLPQVFTTVKAKGTPGGYATINDGYLFGADYVGRDIFGRLVFGTRISLSVAFIGPLMSILFGIIIGSVAGFWGGRLDNIIMRLVDLMYAFPTILLVILMMAYFRSSFAQSAPGTFAFAVNKLDASFGGLLFVFIGIGITSWQNMARLTRGQVLSVREREYVVAAQAIGMSKLSILIRHILPNIIGPLIVAETLAIPAYISTEAFLSFIGLGVNRPTPSWGSMIADGSQALRSFPNQAIFPALALAIAMFAFNFLGDGLRDALDPRMRGVS
ncbi:MAG: ABC transporter permease [Anaerolineae bacterium]|nr:ABC transporter permease [Anaerolineae bacterium]